MWKMACPKCGLITTKEFYVFYQTLMRYKVNVKDGYTDLTTPKMSESHFAFTFHKICGFAERIDPDQLLVKVEGDEIVDASEFYRANRSLLERVAKANNLKIALK